jgi:hypothetical protein
MRVGVALLAPPLSHWASMRGAHPLAITLSALAYLAILLSAGDARAEDRPPAWLSGELAWAERASLHPALASAASGYSVAYATLDHAAPAASQRALPDASLVRQRGRYRTMKVAGYVLAAGTLAIALAFIPAFIKRQEHVDDYGELSCARNTFPYAAPPLFAAGLAVGITGTIRDRQFVQTRGATPAGRTPWRVALAGSGVALALAGLFSSIGAAGFCNS